MLKDLGVGTFEIADLDAGGDFGKVLVVLDKRDYAVSVSQARASLTDGNANAASNRINVPITTVSTRSGLVSARANLASAEAGLNVAKESLEAARANVDQAQANSDRAESDLKRYQQLVEHQDVSRQQYDQALATEKTNKAQLASAKANLSGAEQAVVQSQLRVEQAKADFATAQTAPQQVESIRARAESALAQAELRKAQLEQAELNLSYTEIRAPRDGIIGKKTVEAGQNVVAGQQLMELVPADDIWVTANFKETQLRRMEPGQPVEVSVDAYGKKYHGKVTSIGGATGDRFSLLPPENATGNYVKVVQRIPVRIDLEGADIADKKLHPGMSVIPKVKVQ